NLKPRIKSGFTHIQHIEKAVNEMVNFIDESLEANQVSLA
ncbi:MAG: hypothetical protein ACJAXS_002228, partial [Colwellia sp.]